LQLDNYQPTSSVSFIFSSAECDAQGQNEYIGLGASATDATVVTNGGT